MVSGAGCEWVGVFCFVWTCSCVLRMMLTILYIKLTTSMFYHDAIFFVI